MKSTHKMRLIEGAPGITQRMVHDYRGFRIHQRYRSHDIRNKTHRGYEWSVETPDGRTWAARNRSHAKHTVDLSLIPIT